MNANKETNKDVKQAPSGEAPETMEREEWQTKVDELTASLEAQQAEMKSLREELREAKKTGEPVKTIQSELATALTAMTKMQAQLDELKDEAGETSRKSSSRRPAPGARQSEDRRGSKKPDRDEQRERERDDATTSGRAEKDEEDKKPPAEKKTKQSLADGKGWL